MRARMVAFLVWARAAWVGILGLLTFALVVAAVVLIPTVGSGGGGASGNEKLSQGVEANTQAIQGLEEGVKDLSESVSGLSDRMEQGFQELSGIQHNAQNVQAPVGLAEGFMRIPQKKVLWCPTNGGTTNQTAGGGISIEPLKFRWVEVSREKNTCPQ